MRDRVTWHDLNPACGAPGSYKGSYQGIEFTLDVRSTRIGGTNKSEYAFTLWRDGKATREFGEGGLRAAKKRQHAFILEALGRKA